MQLLFTQYKTTSLVRNTSVKGMWKSGISRNSGIGNSVILFFSAGQSEGHLQGQFEFWADLGRCAQFRFETPCKV